MRNTQAVKDFLFKWTHEALPSKQMLYDYRPICKNLLFEEEWLVVEVLRLLNMNITLWAKSNSHIYSTGKDIISKQDLLDKSLWYVDGFENEIGYMATSGSTTGEPFQYLRWDPFLYFIEAENHYDMILDEFEISENPKILFFFNSPMFDPQQKITIRSDSENFMDHHGKSRKAEVHYVNFQEYTRNPNLYMSEIVSYIARNPMDVIFAPGPAINSICSYARKIADKFGKYRFCKLLSNSNEFLIKEDADFLLNGWVDNICDHMRSWDGGSTFFTCKHKRYHLLDNLSWCEDVDGMLVSTDYFSLPSSFVRYWNGDYCRIGMGYSRCECGRLYRDFEFIENRPFSLKGVSLKELKKSINDLQIDGLKQVRCGLNTIDVVSSAPLSDHQRLAITSTSDKFVFRFISE